MCNRLYVRLFLQGEIFKEAVGGTWMGEQKKSKYMVKSSKNITIEGRKVKI